MTASLAALALLVLDASPGALDGCRAQEHRWDRQKAWVYACEGWGLSLQDAARLPGKPREAVEALLDRWAEDLEPGPHVRTPLRSVCLPWPTVGAVRPAECVFLSADVPVRPKRSADDPVAVRSVVITAMAFERPEGVRVVSCTSTGARSVCDAGLELLAGLPWDAAPPPGVAVLPPASTDPEPLPPPLRACRARPVEHGWAYRCEGYAVTIRDEPPGGPDPMRAIDAALDGVAAAVRRPAGMPAPTKAVEHMPLQHTTLKVVHLDVRTADLVPAWKRSRRKEYSVTGYGGALPRADGTRLLLCVTPGHAGICRTSFDLLSTGPWRGPPVAGSIVEPAAPDGAR